MVYRHILYVLFLMEEDYEDRKTKKDLYLFTYEVL